MSYEGLNAADIWRLSDSRMQRIEGCNIRPFSRQTSPIVYIFALRFLSWISCALVIFREFQSVILVRVITDASIKVVSMNKSPLSYRHAPYTAVNVLAQRGVQFTEEHGVSKGNLKRSKSMSHAHGTLPPVPAEITLFEKHPAAALVKKACFNPDDLQSVQLMELAKVLVDRAMDDRAHAQSYAAFCLNIIERETSGTFLESLLNFSQYTVEKKCYKDGTHRYHAFMGFLNELYSVLKPRQNNLKPLTTVSPTLTVLSLIVQVCQSVLSQKCLSQRAEVECLFFTVTTVGRDIEAEEPKLMDSLMWSVRDAFLSPNTSAPIKKTLLQLVELRATKWHLPATAIMYYQSPNP